MSTHFRASLHELRFFLWDVLGLEAVLDQPPYRGRQRAELDALLDRGQAFAQDMARFYQSADAEGCHLDADGNVHLPDGFADLWQRWRGWDDLGLQAGTDTDAAVIPAPIKQVVMEMLMGANPAFMCFGGFTPPATRLLRTHGTAAQQALLLPPLESFRWDACYCATEADAGSDLLAIRSTGRELGDGSWAVEGEKLYITAGAHDLTENTLYVVLARLHGAAPDSMFLSCFLVPRWWIDEASGERIDNHVRCIDVPRKMGMNGCPNTRLRFGAGGISRGWLLGDRRNAGMLQFATLARHARVNSAIFATGLASTAYLNSVAYASGRIQGRRLHENAVASAPRQPIIAHADVQRMLLDMKARLEACRSLVGRVTWLSAQQELENARAEPDVDALERRTRLLAMLVPVAKTWTAEQAFQVCETALQVHGGIGYTAHAPVEQYLRDVKILSIWEGTSYVQSLLLVRDALGYGRGHRQLDALHDWITLTLEPSARHAQLQGPRAAVLSALDDCRAVMTHLHLQVQAGQLDQCAHHFTRIAGMFGTTLGAWGLLEAAQVALHRLDHDSALDAPSRDFLNGKLKAMTYFVDALLPAVNFSRALITRDPAPYQHITAGELACMDRP